MKTIIISFLALIGIFIVSAIMGIIIYQRPIKFQKEIIFYQIKKSDPSDEPMKNIEKVVIRFDAKIHRRLFSRDYINGKAFYIEGFEYEGLKFEIYDYFSQSNKKGDNVALIHINPPKIFGIHLKMYNNSNILLVQIPKDQSSTEIGYFSSEVGKEDALERYEKAIRGLI